jgi:hypothetical protein
MRIANPAPNDADARTNRFSEFIHDTSSVVGTVIEISGIWRAHTDGVLV